MIVLVDKNTPQIFNFDEAVVFDETPINKVFPVELLLEEPPSVCNAKTSELYHNQIRIVCANSAPLNEGQRLQLNLNALYKQHAKEYFLNIPCTLTRLEKFQQVTHALLTFSEHVNSDFIDWYKQWLDTQQEAHKNTDIDQNAFNFIYQYYKRVYASHLIYPVLFSDTQQIKHAFISKQCSTNITFSNQQKVNIELPINIIQAYIKLQKKETRIALYVWYENDQIHYFSNKDHPTLPSKKIVSWLKTKPQWRVLLIRNREIAPATELQYDEIKQYITKDAVANAAAFEQSFTQLSTTTHILDISCLFARINLPTYTAALAENTQTLDALKVNYQILSFQVKRAEHRFNYQTKLTLTTLNPSNNITIPAESSDISFLGLNIRLPLANYPLKEQDFILVEFTQWNEMLRSSLFKKKAKLEAAEYKIINIYKKDDHISLGLRRIKRDTDPKLNSIIREKIEDIKQSIPGSIHNDFDLYQSLLASLWINNNIAGLPFFLSRDNQGIRIIQAIASTKENLKIRNPYQENNDWSFLQQIALSLDLAINKLNSEKHTLLNHLNIGVYCYYDDTGADSAWKTKTDLDFQSTADKFNFISTAMRYKKHYFYHCALVPITPGKDDILNGESSAFISLAAHRLKEIHEVCRALIAIGELNDVTRLVEFIHT